MAVTDPISLLRGDIVAMSPYTPGEQVNQAVKLNTNECPTPASPAVFQALADLATDRLRQYPDPLATRLRQTAAEVYGVDPAQVLAGNGSDDCLTVLYRAVLRAGDPVAVPWPTYGLYKTLASLQATPITCVPWRDGWQLPDLAASRARLVLIANPNNPSSTLVGTDDLRRLADRLDGVLVVDEAYVDFAAPGSTMLPFLGQHPNLVVLRTFSKSYSLAGARLGLLFGDARLVGHLMKVKDSYNVGSAPQAMGEAALRDQDWHRRLVADILASRDLLERELAAFGWTWPKPHANFLFCQVGRRAGEVYRALKARGILVRWWDTPELREHLRITAGTIAQDQALVAALREIGA